MKQQETEALAARVLKYLKAERSKGRFTPETPAKSTDIILAAKGSGLSITDVDVRAAVHHLRESGEPIGTYFYAWHASELEETEADLTRRAMSILRARSGLRRWKKKQVKQEGLFDTVKKELELEKVA